MKRPLIEKTFPPEVLEALKQAGFEVTTVSSSPERIRVLKHNCAALFERIPGPAGGREGSQLKLVQAPGYILRGEIGRLWDAGYQKFWLLGPVTPRSDSGEADDPFKDPRRPALSEHLRDLHRFSEELKAALAVPSFYNESLGTTNDIAAYDRLKGREPSPESIH